MLDQQVELLLMSYKLTDLLEDNDITEEYVVRLLIEEELIDLEDYFNDY